MTTAEYDVPFRDEDDILSDKDLLATFKERNNPDNEKDEERAPARSKYF